MQRNRHPMKKNLLIIGAVLLVVATSTTAFSRENLIVRENRREGSTNWLLFNYDRVIAPCRRIREDTAPAPAVDRVGFRKTPAETFQLLRTLNNEKGLKVVKFYGPNRTAEWEAGFSISPPR